MTTQRYSIKPREIREAIKSIQNDRKAVLMIDGPACSGKSTICHALRTFFPLLKKRIWSEGENYRSRRKPITLTVANLDERNLVSDGVIRPLVLREIQSIFEGTFITDSILNNEPPWLNDQPPWNTGSRRGPDKLTREEVKAMLMLQRRGSLGRIGADAAMLVCAKLYRASLE